MTTHLPPDTELVFISTPSHGYLRVIGDTETARACATGYDYETDAAVYLEEDLSAGIYLRHYGIADLRGIEQVSRASLSLERIGARRLPAGSLGQVHMDSWRIH